MATNFPGPWEVRLNYTVLVGGETSTHQQRFSFSANTVGVVGDPFTSWIPVTRGGAEVLTLDAQVDAYALTMRDYYSAAFNLVDAELWKYVVGTFDATWYSSKAIALVGTSASAVVQDSEQILVFRSTQGGTMRTHFMQGVVLRGGKQVLPLGNADLDTIVDNLLLTGNVWHARDNGYPIAFLGMYPGENEALFKARFRR